MSVKIEGLDELQNDLDRMKDGVEKLENTDEVAVGELFTNRFMKRYTDFNTVEEFFDASPWSVESESDFEAIPSDDFDEYVSEHSVFEEWEGMLGKAGEQYVKRQLGF